MGKSSYTPAEVDTGLLALITYGSSNRAADECGIPAQTLREWRKTRAERLAELQAEHGPAIEQALVHAARSIALSAAAATSDAIEGAHQDILNGDVKDKAAAARNLQTTGAIAIDKLLALTGRPTQITEHRSADDYLRKLESLGIIEGTATEEPPPERRSLASSGE